MLFRTLLIRLLPRPSHRQPRRPVRGRLALEALEDRAVPAALTVVMSGLDNPRGLAFGPQGALYVAESGEGGDGPSFEIRPGVVSSYGATGAVSRLWHGTQERVATGLPSLIAPDGATGPQDILVLGDGTAFVTIGFGANPTRRGELGEVGADFAQLVLLQPNGDRQNIADLGAYEAAGNPGGGPIDSNPFGLLAEPSGRVVVDAGGNTLLRVAANGDITTLASFPSRDDGRSTDAVPNSVAVGPDGAYYVGELTGVPFAPGAARVYRVVPGEAPTIAYTGFTAIIDVAFGPDGSLYVLQHATGPFLSGNGALIRVAPDGTRTTLASEGLVKPTSVLVGADGAIYVSNRGTSVDTGEVVRVNVPATFTVVNFADSGEGSLRQAVLDANAKPGTDRIEFAPTARDGTITLATGELALTDDVIIAGPGAGRLAVSGNDASRVFRVQAGVTADIADLTVTRGSALLRGGGVVNDGTLILSRAVVSDNQVVGLPGVGAAVDAFGGGVFNTGSLTVVQTSFLRNLATGGAGVPGGPGSAGLGGAIMSLGSPGAPATVTVSQGLFFDNQARGGAAGDGGPSAGNGLGGAVMNDAGTVTVSQSLFQGNRARGGQGGGSGGFGAGGAIANVARFGDASLLVGQSLLLYNQALGGSGTASGQVGRGGAIANFIFGGLPLPVTVRATASVGLCVLVGNQAVGGAGLVGGTGQGGGIANEGGGVLSVTDALFSRNRALGGAGSGGNGGNGLGGGLFNGAPNRVGTPSLSIRRSAIVFNQAEGGASAGGSVGLGLGGGVYVGLGGSASTDLGTLIFGNRASTSDNEVFGILTVG